MESEGVGADAVLPPLFARWMDALLPGPIPAERNATCERCAMVQPDVQTGDSEFFYSPSTKCCTYLPELSNFLVGRILSDGDPAAAVGRASVEARIAKGAGVTPLALHRTAVYTLLYRTSPASFGQAKAMRCPHYLEEGGGRCGVWKHRESTCATWFCKYGRGSNGRNFWQRLHDTLGVVEDAIRTHCLLQLGLDASALSRLFLPHSLTIVAARQDGISASDVDGEVNRATYDAIWGNWRGREKELFVACSEIAEPLRWPDIQRLGGVRLELLSRLLLEAYESLVSDVVPPRVHHRQLKIVYSSSETVQAVGYSNIDPLRIPKKLVDVLHHFDGRPTADVLEEIDQQHGLRIATGTVRKLVDFELLSTK